MAGLKALPAGTLVRVVDPYPFKHVDMGEARVGDRFEIVAWDENWADTPNAEGFYDYEAYQGGGPLCQPARALTGRCCNAVNNYWLIPIVAVDPVDPQVHWAYVTHHPERRTWL